MRSAQHGPRRRRGRGQLAADGGRARVGALYERLPHGPHQLDRKEVARNQRLRIHGAMIEAVSRYGYEQASVKNVITLAGVSRRSFYEQFDNKRDCFLATFDLLAARELHCSRDALDEAGDSVDARLRALVGAQLGNARERPKATHLLLLDTLAVGDIGLARMCRAAAGHEQLLGECFQGGTRGGPPPAPLLRALVGGLQGVLATRLHRAVRQPPREPLVEWALALHGSRAGERNAWLARRLRERMRALSLESAAASRSDGASGRRRERRAAGLRADPPAHLRADPAAPPASSPDARDHVLEAALRLAARHGHRELTTPQIADAAGISIEALLAQFATPEACVAAAYAMAAEQLHAVAIEACAGAPDWPRAVRPLVGALLVRLAAQPLHAHALVQSSWCLGPHTAATAYELTAQLAELLAPGTPATAPGATAAGATPPATRGTTAAGATKPGATAAGVTAAGATAAGAARTRSSRARRGAPPLVGEAAVHALWHTVRCLLVTGRAQLLPALTDHLSFLVLAPSLGAEPALELLRGER